MWVPQVLLTECVDEKGHRQVDQLDQGLAVLLVDRLPAPPARQLVVVLRVWVGVLMREG
jgi:hypothetical protein